MNVYTLKKYFNLVLLYWYPGMSCMYVCMYVCAFIRLEIGYPAL